MKQYSTQFNAHIFIIQILRCAIWLLFGPRTLCNRLLGRTVCVSLFWNFRDYKCKCREEPAC